MSEYVTVFYVMKGSDTEDGEIWLGKLIGHTTAVDFDRS